MRPQPDDRPVLIVDDDPDTLDVLGNLIASWGYPTALAGGGRQALDWLDHNPAPRVMLLDLGMPTPDGWQVLEALRESGRIGDVPVAVCSGMAGCARPESLEGARARFVKPLDPAGLQEWLTRVA